MPYYSQYFPSWQWQKSRAHERRSSLSSCYNQWIGYGMGYFLLCSRSNERYLQLSPGTPYEDLVLGVFPLSSSFDESPKARLRLDADVTGKPWKFCRVPDWFEKPKKSGNPNPNLRGTLRYTIGFPVAKIGFLRPKSVSYGTMWPRLRVLLINKGIRFFVRDYAATYTETCSSVLNFRSLPIFNDFGNFK